ncbi:MAG: DivIVA domain-containing protein [Acidimicrobiia bacterium]
MASNVTPDSLRQSRFRTAFRGFDPSEVQAVLEAAAAKLEALDAERRKLQNKLAEEPAAPEMAAEFERVGSEVTAILQSAREAAESMRERASLDATRWRTEATEESETIRREAAADAESLRRDAWVTGSELLEQTSTKAESMRATAERDVLTIMGEAEREAHRLTSGARREAEDVVRNATMEAEKITSDATTRRDEIIDAANRQSAAAQERTRALEQRRDELLDELENVRSTLTRLEGSLEERREALDLTSAEPSSVRVVHPPADAKENWELGETVRVVPQGESPVHMEGDSSEMSAESPAVEPAPREPDPAPSPEPEPVTEPEPGTDHAPEPQTAAEAEEPAISEPPVEPAPSPQQEEGDDVGALFASLRGTDHEERGEQQETTDEGAADAGRLEPDGIDWIEVREERLLPVTNRALRGVKKAMTEVQNVALDSLRTDEDWRPDEKSIAESVHAELVAVWSESFAAGHSVAEQMTGAKLKRPPTPSSKADRDFASALVTAISGVLDKAGEGPRERQSAASRVFRVWRSDEAERRIRDIALQGYESGIEKSRRVDTPA